MNTYKISSCQDYKIQKLAEVIEQNHGLRKGSHYHTMSLMVRLGYLTPEELINVLEHGVRKLRETPGGHAQNTLGLYNNQEAANVRDCL